MLFSFCLSFIIILFLKTQFILFYDFTFSFSFGILNVGEGPKPNTQQTLVYNDGSKFRKMRDDEA